MHTRDTQACDFLANPYAALKLQPGWRATCKGVGYKSERIPELTAYSIVFWVQNAIPEQDYLAWLQEKSRLTAAMAQAGQRGAYGKLRLLNTELAAAFDKHIELSLRAGAGEHMSPNDVQVLAECLQQSPLCHMSAWAICGNHVHVITELALGADLAQLVQIWQASTPNMHWAGEFYSAAYPAAQIGTHVAELMQELGTDGLLIADSHACSHDVPPFEHTTVLLHETVDLLNPAPGKLIIDCTLGGGGHSELLLERGATVIGIDQDPHALAAATERLRRFGERFHALAGNFCDIKALLAAKGIVQVDGILADLGVSSPQLDNAERGFSFREDGPLDMRMNPHATTDAFAIVNTTPEAELADILRNYGEERAARAIAKAIVAARAQAPINTTAQLADIVARVLPRKSKQHPATRTFQAIRIAVNQELSVLQTLLRDALELLAKGGRLAVITFHSLEDRPVKHALEQHSKPESDRPEWPAPRPNPDYCLRLLTRKPVIAGEQELAANPRARSAKLRAAEKII